MLVWLEDADEPSAVLGGVLIHAQGAERRVDLGWVVPVVVDDLDTIATPEQLESAIESVEGIEGLCEQFWISPDGSSQCKRDGGVHRVVLSRQREIPGMGLSIWGLDSGDAVLVSDDPIGAGIESDGFDVALESGGDFPSERAVVSDDELPALISIGYELRELREGFDDRIERAVDIEVVRFDGTDGRDGWSEVMEGAVELARFSEEDARLAPPLVASELRRDGTASDSAADSVRGLVQCAVFELLTSRADDDRWVELRVRQGASEHRGGCGFAVGSSDRNSGASGHARTQCFRVRENGQPSIRRFDDHWVFGTDRGGCENDVDVFWESICGFIEADIDVDVLECFGDRRWGGIASLDMHPGAAEHASERGHAAPSDPDHVGR